MADAKPHLFTSATAGAAARLATPEAKRAGRMKLSPERRSEIARAGALARQAKLSAAERQAHASKMGKAADAKRDPLERRASCRAGSIDTTRRRWGHVPAIIRPLVGPRNK